MPARWYDLAVGQQQLPAPVLAWMYQRGGGLAMAAVFAAMGPAAHPSYVVHVHVTYFGVPRLYF